MLLAGSYDHRQLWLPIFERAYFRPVPETNSPRPVRTPQRTNMVWSHADIASSQEVFAFDATDRLSTTKRISNRQITLLERHNYPTFDKRNDGSVYLLLPRSSDNTAQWCSRNIKRRYWITSNCAIFEKRTDFIIALLSGHFSEPARDV